MLLRLYDREFIHGLAFFYDLKVREVEEAVEKHLGRLHDDLLGMFRGPNVIYPTEPIDTWEEWVLTVRERTRLPIHPLSLLFKR